MHSFFLRTLYNLYLVKWLIVLCSFMTLFSQGCWQDWSQNGWQVLPQPQPHQVYSTYFSTRTKQNEVLHQPQPSIFHISLQHYTIWSFTTNTPSIFHISLKALNNMKFYNKHTKHIPHFSTSTKQYEVLPQPRLVYSTFIYKH